MIKKNNARSRELVRLLKKSKGILKDQGIGILLKKVRFEVSRRLFGVKFEGRRIRKSDAMPVRMLVREKFPNIRPIGWMEVNRDTYRLNIVTDSLQKDSLFGGVATSLILATLFVNKYDIPLRIITRTMPPNARGYDDLLRLMHIKRPNAVEFFSDWDAVYSENNLKLEVSDKDIFMATSWWTAEVIRGVNLRKEFFYILQEVETFFYSHSDELFCESVLKNNNINFIINSKLLSDYYKSNDFKNIIEKSVYFEPAFPKMVETTSLEKTLPEKEMKRRLFFYARPHNARNLYFTGLKLLDEALLRGIIKKDEWEICFAGSSSEMVEFTTKVRPIMLGQMSWEEYGAFLKTVDLAFCLMFTPHPSYPPLDVASSGGVVLTNKYANKTTLDNYSQNIICADVDEESMMQGFIDAVELANNDNLREKNFKENGTKKDWSVALEHVLEFMNEKK